MMRQDRFTEQAQEVLAASQELVRKERHAQWDVEHVLLALVTTQGGAAPAIFEQLRSTAPSCSEAVGRGAGQSAQARLRRRPDLHHAPHRAHAGGRQRRGRAAEGRVRGRGAHPHRHRRRARGRGGAHPPPVRASTRRRSTTPWPGVRGDARVDSPSARVQVPRPGALQHRPDGGRPPGQARPRHRPRGRDQAGDAGAQPAHQEQPGDHRRGRRRQDRHRRGAGPEDRGRRRAREPEGQARAGPGHGRDGRRQQVPRRVRGAAEGGDGRDQAGPGRGHRLHRRDPPGGGRRRRRGRHRRLHHDEARPRPRRAPVRRRLHPGRLPQAHREGPGAGAPLLARLRRRAHAGGHDRDAQGPAAALRGAPQGEDQR